MPDLGTRGGKGLLGVDRHPHVAALDRAVAPQLGAQLLRPHAERDVLTEACLRREGRAVCLLHGPQQLHGGHHRAEAEPRALAHRYLQGTGTGGKKRKNVVDTLSAQIILQDYLDRERNRQGF